MADVDRMLAKIRQLKALTAKAAEHAAPFVQKVAQDIAASGVDPNSGQPWPETEKGARALKNVAGSIVARARDTVVQVVIKDHYVFHLHARKGRPARRAIPMSGDAIPREYAAAIKAAAKKAFVEVTR